MTHRAAFLTASGALRRIGWLVPLALTILLAACGQGGTYSY